MKKAKPAILVTGGAGAIGSALVEHLLKTKGDTHTIRVFDSDEYGIWQLQQKLKGNPNVRYFLGSVRDYPRIEEAMHGVKHVFHTAAYKHVALCEYNPFDAVETNVIGTQNTIRAAIASGSVEKFLYISTDKAVNPTSLMGATKLIGERLVIAAKYVSGLRPTRLSAARFPNVIQTRGNVFEAWPKQLEKDGKILVTDPEMTRYFLPIDSAIDFLMEAFEFMEGGEVFIPNLTEADTRKIVDVAKEWLSTQDKKGEIVFGSPEYGEKLFEKLHTDVEAPYIEVLSDTLRVIRSPGYDFIRWMPDESK
ncbi:MAG: polysaccharide biosynthesis protein [Candidatus Thorarchaeota archaeon]|jgi:FlaA1/EpsC-like NDP-sugar epimerase